MIRSVFGFLIAFCSVLLVGCASHNLPTPRADAPLVAEHADAAIRQRLIGHWQEVRVVGNLKFVQEMNLFTDGTFEVHGVIEASKESNAFVWRGNWYVKDRKFGYITTYSDTPNIFPIGEPMEDDILSVSDTEWVMQEQSTGNKSIASRVK